jgi:hypothetical protein
MLMALEHDISRVERSRSMDLAAAELLLDLAIAWEGLNAPDKGLHALRIGIYRCCHRSDLQAVMNLGQAILHLEKGERAAARADWMAGISRLNLLGEERSGQETPRQSDARWFEAFRKRLPNPFAYANEPVWRTERRWPSHQPRPYDPYAEPPPAPGSSKPYAPAPARTRRVRRQYGHGYPTTLQTRVSHMVQAGPGKTADWNELPGMTLDIETLTLEGQPFTIYQATPRLQLDFGALALLTAVQVDGDSMTAYGIDPGDILLVRPQEDASHNQVVVAAVKEDPDWVYTTKLYVKSSGTVHLEPRSHNPAYQPIPFTPCDPNIQIRGVVVAWLKPCAGE